MIRVVRSSRENPTIKGETRETHQGTAETWQWVTSIPSKKWEDKMHPTKRQRAAAA